MPPLSNDTSSESSKTYNLWVHDDRFSKQDVVINPDCFPGIKPGDLIEIYHPPSQPIPTSNSKSEYTEYDARPNNSDEHPLILQVEPSDVDILAKQPQLQISIANHIAAVFGLQARKDIVVRKVDAESIAADYIEFTFKDQYIGRSDMWRLKMSLAGSCVHAGKKITFAGCVRVQVKEIYAKGETAMCGYITENTRTIFRSESAKYYIFIQMSREMWDFDEDGMLFFEKATHNFLPDLFKRWNELGTNHIASIVMFTRVFYEYSEELAKDGLLLQTSDNRWYKDYYKVVADWETRSDWSTAIVHLKNEFATFRKDILELHRDKSTYLSGENTMANEGNILEAINLALNAFDKHYVDRDLLRTGLSIVLITPGTGIFEVDKKLLRITTERMIDNGIGLDLVCLSKYPLYTVPIFKFTSSNVSNLPDASKVSEPKLDKKYLSADHGKSKFSDKSSNENSEKLDMWDPLYYDDPNPNNQLETYYAMPHWIDCSFYSINDEGNRPSRRFVPRCKMYNLQMMGVMEHEMAPISIEYLDDKYIVPTKIESNSEEKSSYAFDKYDEDIFQSDSRRTLKLKQSLKARSLREIIAENSDEPIQNTESTGVVLDSGFPRRSFEDLSYDKAYDTRSVVAEPFGSLPKTMISSSFATSGMYVARRHHPRHVSHSEEKAHKIDIAPSKKKLRNTERVEGKNINQPEPHVQISEINGSQSEPNIVNGNDATEIGTSTVKPIMINNCNTRMDTKRPILDSTSYQSRSDSMAGSLASGVNRYSAKQSSPSKGFASRQTIRQTLIKPCNPTKNVIKISSHLRRWHHIFPKPVPIDCTKWISLCSPACLPLTTDFFPTADELADFYQEYTYTVSPNEEIGTFAYQDGPGSDQSITERLLLDMISQRLAQGFQLVVSSSIENPQKHPEHSHLSFSPAENNGNGPTLSRSFNNNEQDVSKFGVNRASKATPYYLSMGHHVHKLWYDNTGQNVEVKRYVRRLAYTMKPISYSCAVWPKYMDEYQPRQVSFHYPVLSQYNWNYLDHLISGYQDEMTDSLRFWRARFALIPVESVPSNHLTNPSHENLDEEELRLAGFFKFQELLWKVRWDPTQERSETRNVSNKKQLSNKLDIKFTTCHTSVFVNNHWYTWGEHTTDPTPSPFTSRKGSGYVATSEKMVTKEAKLSTIAAAMQNTVTGVRLQDRRWHFKLFEGVFVGNEFIDWLIREFSDLDTRDEALEFGNSLMKQGLFVHVYRKHRLLDGHYFYQLGTEFAAARNTRSWGVFRNTKNNNDSNTKTLDDQVSMSEKKPGKIELSRSITIDLDSSKRSDRPERAILHYDVVHNPKACYHFQLDWLDCTARLIEDLLQSWSRTADKCGLKLVEVPVQQARKDSSDNPFQAPVSIKMAVPPPPLNILQEKAENLAHIPHLYFEIELVKHHGFVLDLEADEFFPAGIEITHSYYKTPVRYSQYIHRSGVALIQICEPGEGFLWVNNRLFTSHNNSGNQNKNYSNQLPNPDILRIEFQKFCHDPKRLSDFWEDTVTKFSVETVVENYGSDLQTIPCQTSMEKEAD
ncbi:hypothetical protein K493DRAFT_337883 [Basidiobolus meristosporus CBS 931.73]|uniref:Vacuolar membrane-associated protein IML1 n=1 Tax=Basidiobolus meristosporus CBS 931.73 TaxID=1314790 RepID=A0A1Y1Y8C4_9FUNG|nr:hypothetical protein K493DRAFT_337883 [Basidiobolus meristosporus CBS 931.73]|eukprot:ORX94228.1 hypothetical protein K493DRAFT_337883 [Basidiobolus meristosporus CBS 931.73]